MNERSHLNCVYILVFSILLRPIASNCYQEFLKDTSSNLEDNRDVIEEQQNKLDPSIEQIFRGPSDRKTDAINLKRNVESEATKEDSSKHVRVKRDDGFKKSDTKSLSESAKKNEKRSASKTSKVSLRPGRSSRDLPKLPDKDYESPGDQDKSEYLDDTEDESVLMIAPQNKESRYKSGEVRVGDDSERFIDQEERSSLYDDFEAKDVVKRGISGAEDYEELEDEGIDSADDTIALDEKESSDDEIDRKKIHGDVRVKREHVTPKETENLESGVKSENLGTSGDTSVDAKVADPSAKREVMNDKDKLVDSPVNKVESNDQVVESQSRISIPEKIDSGNIAQINGERETDVSKQLLAGNDQTELENNENLKIQVQNGQDTIGDRKIQDIGLSSNERSSNDLLNDSSGLKGTSKSIDESKITDLTNPEVSKIEIPPSVLENAPSEDMSRLDNSKSESVDQNERDYEKRVEEQIQRKIDSIKEEIKREIAENQRIKEIEENNARFDELRDQEEDEENEMESEVAERSNDLAKRSPPVISGKIQVRDNVEKKSIKRKKRQGNNVIERSSSDPDLKKKTRQTSAKKRSLGKPELTGSLTLTEIPKKREIPRQIYLVKRDRNAGKKKRRRRSKNEITEQRNAKLEDSLPADLMSDSNFKAEMNGGKQSSGLKLAEDEKAVAEQDSLSQRKSGAVASLTGSNEETGPLATEYGDAFGGFNGEPGMALARFKRIKRVLRSPGSKS